MQDDMILLITMPYGDEEQVQIIRECADGSVIIEFLDPDWGVKRVERDRLH